MTPRTDTTIVTPQTKIAILKHLTSGRDLTFTAQVTRTTEDQARQVAASHGVPDKAKMRWAIDILTKQVDANTDVISDRPLTEGLTVFEKPPTTPAATAHTAPRPPAATAGPDPTTQLLQAAEKSSKKRTNGGLLPLAACLGLGLFTCRTGLVRWCHTCSRLRRDGGL